MKRAAFILASLMFAVAAWGQANTSATQSTPPAQSAQPAAGTPAVPQGKRPPQAKTQPEFDAYKVAAGDPQKPPEPAVLEKAADDFATKFPDSELRVLLYKMATRAYQTANNAEKSEAMGRKVLAIDGDDPESLIVVAEVIAERTHDSDLDKDQRYDEAMKLAQKATQTVDTDLAMPPDKLEQAKGFLRSSAYSVMGTIDFKKENYPSAQANLQKAIDAFPSQPDPVVVLRLAIALDKQTKYPEALKIAEQAVSMTQENTQVGTLARNERTRLQQLTGNGTPAAPAQSQPPKN